MKKLKIPVAIIITLGLLYVFACLPKIVAGVLDFQSGKTPSFNDIHPVELEITTERQPLSAAGKLVLLRQAETISVTENKTNMTVSEVNAALEAQMDQYVAAGIFDWFDYTSWITQPYLCVSLDEPDQYSIFWTVTILNKNEPYQCLNVDIDDETGNIFSIHFDQYGSYSLSGVWERNYSVMDAFVSVYLNGLGLPEETLGANVEPNLEYGELDDEVLRGSLTLEDREYGRIGLEFYVTGSGSFYVYIPEFLE